MKRLTLLLIPILLVGCITTAPEPVANETTLPTEEEALETILVAVEEPPVEYTNTLFTSEEEILPTPHDEWLEAKDLWDTMEMEKADVFPGYEVQPYPVADPDAVAEAVTEEPHSLPTPTEAFTDPSRQRSVNLGSNTVPDWFVYICTVLILATLVSLCYIAKQKKESRWHIRGN